MRGVSFSLVALATALSTSWASAALTSVDLQSAGDGLLTVDSVSGLAWLDLSVTQGLSAEQAWAGPWQNQGFRLATRDEVQGLLNAAVRVEPDQPFLALLGAVPASPELSAWLGGPTLTLSGVIAGDLYVPDNPVVPLCTLYETRMTSLPPVPGDPDAPLTDYPGPGIGETVYGSEVVYGGSASSSTSSSSPLVDQVRDVVSSQGPSLTLGTYIRLKESAIAMNQAQADAGVFLVRDISPVPEASTWAMMAVGLVGLGWASRRRRLQA